MPLFSTPDTVPDTQYYESPDYLKHSKNDWMLNAVGFKNSGEKNDWGKVISWLNPIGAMVGDKIAAKEFSKLGASDSSQNAGEYFQKDLGKLEVVGGVAQAALGDVKGGISTAMTGIGTNLNAPDEGTSDDSGTYYKNNFYALKKGGEMKSQAEDIDMIDKDTDEKVGEISYGEGVLSRMDYSKMKNLWKLGNKKELGNLAFKIMSKHNKMKEDFDSDEEMLTSMDNEYSKGGELTASKAAEILHDGTVHGKPITDKQRKYFGWISSGRKKMGGEINQYADGTSSFGVLRTDENSAPSWGDFNQSILGDNSQYSNTGNLSGQGADILGKIGGIEQVFSLAQALTGLIGAQGDLPTYEKPKEWTDYVREAAKNSHRGLSPQELAQMNDANQTAFSLGETNARNLSGGNSAFALGATSKAADDWRKGAMKIAALNEQEKRNNFDKYGNIISHDERLGREIFNDKFKIDYETKKAAGQLANTGLQQFIDRGDYEKSYGKGSTYDNYLKALTKSTDASGNIDWKKFYELYGKNIQLDDTVTSTDNTSYSPKTYGL